MCTHISAGSDRPRCLPTRSSRRVSVSWSKKSPGALVRNPDPLKPNLQCSRVFSASDEFGHPCPEACRVAQRPLLPSGIYPSSPSLVHVSIHSFMAARRERLKNVVLWRPRSLTVIVRSGPGPLLSSCALLPTAHPGGTWMMKSPFLVCLLVLARISPPQSPLV